MPLNDRSQSLDQVAAAIGKRIRSARKRAGLTLIELAEASGTTRSVLQGRETGAHRITAAQLVIVAQALEVPPASLLGDQSDMIVPDPLEGLITPDSITLLQGFAWLDATQRGRIMKRVDAMATSRKRAIKA